MAPRSAPNADHDEKSVEPKNTKRLDGFRAKQTEQEHNVIEAKQCTNCLLWFPPVASCFDVDNANRTGRQSYCVECKDAWELTEDARFRRMRSYLIDAEPVAWAVWESCAGGAFAEFQRRLTMQQGVCKHCGAGLREWQTSGHNLDRIDNNDGTLHAPPNTVFACSPCNMTRGRKRWDAWRVEAKARAGEYGWGNVPWGELDDRFTRVVRRKCKHLAVAPPQLSFGKLINSEAR